MTALADHTYTTTVCDGDLQHVMTRLNDSFKKYGSHIMSVPSINGQRHRVDRHRDRGRPVGLHQLVFVVETFELDIQIGSETNTSPLELITHSSIQRTTTSLPTSIHTYNIYTTWSICWENQPMAMQTAFVKLTDRVRGHWLKLVTWHAQRMWM
jgi:hypothetical protein